MLSLIVLCLRIKRMCSGFKHIVLGLLTYKHCWRFSKGMGKIFILKSRTAVFETVVGGQKNGYDKSKSSCKNNLKTFRKKEKVLF